MGYVVYENNKMQLFSIIYFKYKFMLKETDKAVQFEIEDKTVWLPKSIIAIDPKEKVVAIPSTIAFRSGVLPYRIEPKRKLDEKSLKSLQMKQKRRQFNQYIGKTAI